jgi:isoleucyl-tRNA synthetase
MRLDNVREFYELYRDKNLESDIAPTSSSNALDRWILARLQLVLNEVTEGMEKYELDAALRPLALFVDDLSTWYLRRSRERIKEGDADAKKTLVRVLVDFSKLLAPFAPFVAEDTYRALRREADPESVHLTVWPKVPTPEDLLAGHVLLDEMAQVRDIVTLGLEARQKANIKVRQPLREIRIKNQSFSPEYQELIKDELNVKEVVHDKTISEEVVLDTLVTAELKEEGMLREFIRAVQDARKNAGLHPEDRISLVLTSNDDGKKFVWAHEAEIKKDVNAEILTFVEDSREGGLIEGMPFLITPKKI